MQKNSTVYDHILKIMRITGVQLVVAVMFSGLAIAHDNHAQEVLNRPVSLTLKEVSLEQALIEIGGKAQVKFGYSRNKLKLDEKVTLEAAEQKLGELLDALLLPRSIKYTVQEGEDYIILTENAEEDLQENTAINSDPKALITGKVSSASGEPMPGVNVVVKGTTIGVSTDAEGKYSIEANDGDVLIFSFIGFKTLEVTVSNQTVIDLTMEEDVATLGEVVVNAGYYNVKDRERTGNISRVTAKEINNQPIVNPLQAIYGRVPGVYIEQTSGVPGGSFRIKIRGQNSVRTMDNSGIDANAPLYVIDGVPFSFETLSSTYASNGSLGSAASPLNAINPADIESIEILKDADATAIYGSRGANGVVLITTKKGVAGKTKFDINVNTGFGEVASKIDLLNTKQYIEMRNEAFANESRTPGASDYDVNGTWDQNRYTDWQDVLLGGTAKTTLAQLSLSGGNANTKFLIGGTYRKETTVFPADFRYLKGSSHFSINHVSPNNKLIANLSVNYTAEDNNQVGADLSTPALTLAPNAPKLYNDDGTLNWENYTWDNPLAQLKQTFSNKTNTLLTNAVFGYEIIPGLQVKTSLGLTNQRSKEILKVPHTAYSPVYGLTSAASQAVYTSGDLTNWIIEPQINWKRKIALGDLELLVGSTFQNQNREASVNQGIGFSSNELMDNPLSASVYARQSYDKSIYRYNAFFGRINYNWQGKYIVNLTGRRDGSSRFGPGKQFANFGAFGAAWIFSNEGFIKNGFSLLSFGKIRTSYGTTGNDQIGDYKYLNTYAPAAGYQGVSGLSPSSLFNSEFGWEVNKKFEVAMDLGFLQDRIYLSASYYLNRSSSQLVEYSLPSTTGFSSITSNFPATVENRGLEIELRTINIKKNSIEWSTSFNITIPENELVDFPDLESSPYADQYIVGKSLYITQVYHHLGVDPVTGVHRIKDYSGDGVITTADRKSVVEISQKFYGGLNNSVKFKRFELDFLFQFVNQTGTNALWQSALPGRANRNQPALVLDRWQNEGDDTSIQKYATGNSSPANSIFNRYRGSDAGISDASFIRLRNLSLSYRLPDDLIKGVSGSIYLQGQNLLTITNYKGRDPEAQSNSYLPPLRIISIGVQIGL